MPEVEAKVPRPREWTLGGEGAGGGPMRASRGSESEAGEWTRGSEVFGPLFVGFGSL